GRSPAGPAEAASSRPAAASSASAGATGPGEAGEQSFAAGAASIMTEDGGIQFYKAKKADLVCKWEKMAEESALGTKRHVINPQDKAKSVSYFKEGMAYLTTEEWAGIEADIRDLPEAPVELSDAEAAHV